MTEPASIKAALVHFCLRVDDDIEIRLLHANDAGALYELTTRNRDFLKPWMSWIDKVIDVSDSHAFLRAAERQANEHTSFKAGIWRCSDLIGAVDLHDIDWNNSYARIGYWLDERNTGQGIMTSAVRLLSDYAFEALGLHRLEIHVATENHRSRRVPERLGFTLEGILREVQPLRGEYLDHALYALISDDTSV